jgi:hypothetical protein
MRLQLGLLALGGALFHTALAGSPEQYEPTETTLSAKSKELSNEILDANSKYVGARADDEERDEGEKGNEDECEDNDVATDPLLIDNGKRRYGFKSVSGVDRREIVETAKSRLGKRHEYLDDCKYVKPGTPVPDPNTFTIHRGYYDNQPGDCWDLCMGARECRNNPHKGKICFDFHGQAFIATLYPPESDFHLLDASITLAVNHEPHDHSPTYSLATGGCFLHEGGIKCYIPYTSITRGGGIKQMCPLGGGQAWILNMLVCAQAKRRGKTYSLYSKAMWPDQEWWSLTYNCTDCGPARCYSK